MAFLPMTGSSKWKPHYINGPQIPFLAGALTDKCEDD